MRRKHDGGPLRWEFNKVSSELQSAAALPPLSGWVRAPHAFPDRAGGSRGKNGVMETGALLDRKWPCAAELFGQTWGGSWS